MQIFIGNDYFTNVRPSTRIGLIVSDKKSSAVSSFNKGSVMTEEKQGKISSLISKNCWILKKLWRSEIGSNFLQLGKKKWISFSACSRSQLPWTAFFKLSPLRPYLARMLSGKYKRASVT